MTETKPNHQIARITGESLPYAHFSRDREIADQEDGQKPENGTLVVDCPFCGRTVLYPGLAGDGARLLAECEQCDIYFEIDIKEVYTLSTDHRACDANECGDPEQGDFST